MRLSDWIQSSWVLAAEARRLTINRVWRGRRLRWRAKSGNATSFRLALKDPHEGDPDQAGTYYLGQYTFLGETIETEGQSPFQVSEASESWLRQLHSFQWLRHLDAVKSDLANAQGAAYILDWITQHSTSRESAAWDADVVSERLIAWSAHAPGFFVRADGVSRRQVLRSMDVQAQFLARALTGLRDGYPKLQAIIALNHALCCTQTRDGTHRRFRRLLDRELSRQVQADGTHISRNPGLIPVILAQLLPLRDACLAQDEQPTPELLGAIDRLTTALTFFRHATGELAQFNGTGQVSPMLLAALDEETDTQPNTQRSAPYGGYERLQAGKTVLLMDTGSPVSRHVEQCAMAGCLSYELSSGKNLVITNCGLPAPGFEAYLPFARATAAHSTATIDDTSSCHFADSAKLRSWLPGALVAHPEHVDVDRQSADGHDRVVASHDGYARTHGLIHRRTLELSDDGSTINCADRFEPTSSGDNQTGSPLALRFHLAPDITASLLANGHSIVLAAPNRETWTFTCVDAPIALEESIRFCAPEGPRKCEQIVVLGHSRQNREIRWTLVRRAKTGPARTRKAKEAAPDLLERMV